MKKVILLLIFTVAANFVLRAQNVNGLLFDATNTATRNTAAAFEVNANTNTTLSPVYGGFLMPRVALSGTTDNTTIAGLNAGSTALLVYNTTAAGSGGTAVTPGFYYWDNGTTSWIRLLTPSNLPTSLKWNALTDPDGNLTLSHGTNATVFNFANTTTTGFAINGTAQSSGTLFNIASSNAAQTGNSFLVSSNSTGNFGATGGIRYNFTGAHTGSGFVIDDVTTAGTAMSINANSITTGAGNGLVVNANGMTSSTGNGLLVSSTGVYTGANGIFAVTANSATTGTVAKITANGLTSGSGLSISSTGTIVTGGELVDVIANSATTGNVMSISSNGLTTGNALNISATGTVGNNSKLINLTRSGTNGVASMTNYGMYSAITNTGATSTNVAGYLSASGATNNYALIVPSTGGRVGLGTLTPLTTLDIGGAESFREATAAAAAAVTIPDNVSLFRLTLVAGTTTNTLTLLTPQEGQVLTIYNQDGDPATFAGVTIPATTGIAQFQYINTAWRLLNISSGGTNLVRWDQIAAPSGNLSLAHGTNTTNFSWATGTGASDLFTYTSASDATGTGSLINIVTPGTTNALTPLKITANGNPALFVHPGGSMIGAGTNTLVNMISGSSSNIFHLHDAGTTANDFGQLNVSTASVTAGTRSGVLNFAATAVTNDRRTGSIESYLTAYSAPNASGDLRFFTNNVNSYTEKMRIGSNGTITFTQPALSASTPNLFVINAGAHTNLTLSAEASDINFNLARTVQFATGALATQRAMRIQAPTYAFVGASTITNAATLSISGAPVAGSNATIANNAALYVESGNVRIGNLSGTGTRPVYADANGNLAINATISSVEPIYIRGTGLNRNANRVLRIGTTEVYNLAGGRGLRLTIITKATHAVVSTTDYDTYGSTAQSDLLATALNGLTNAQIGVLTSNDAWEGAINANLQAAFLRLGLYKAYLTTIGVSRQPYAAIFEGATGSTIPTATACEVQHSSDAATDYAEIRGFLIDDSFIASTQQPSGLSTPVGAYALGVNQSGNVGIGVLPGTTFKLEVNGKLKSAGIDENSDMRLKKDINPIYDALIKVTQMRGVTYNWRKDEFPERSMEADLQYGLIAQELEKVIPELVTTDNEGWKSIEYSHLVPVLIEAIKELDAKNNTQKAELDKQSKTNSELKASIENLLIRMNVLENNVDVKSNKAQK